MFSVCVWVCCLVYLFSQLREGMWIGSLVGLGWDGVEGCFGGGFMLLACHTIKAGAMCVGLAFTVELAKLNRVLRGHEVGYVESLCAFSTSHKHPHGSQQPERRVRGEKMLRFSYGGGPFVSFHLGTRRG